MINFEFQLSNDGARALAQELADFIGFETMRMQTADIGESALGYVAARTLQKKLQNAIDYQELRWKDEDRKKNQPTVREKYDG